MLHKADQDRVRELLTEAILVLCKNGLSYKSSLSVQGLLGITLDDNDIFLVEVKESVKIQQDINSHDEESSDGESIVTSSPNKKARKRRKRSKSFDNTNEPEHKRRQSEISDFERGDEVSPIVIKQEHEEEDENSVNNSQEESYFHELSHTDSYHHPGLSPRLQPAAGCSTWDPGAVPNLAGISTLGHPLVSSQVPRSQILGADGVPLPTNDQTVESDGSTRPEVDQQIQHPLMSSPLPLAYDLNMCRSIDDYVLTRPMSANPWLKMEEQFTSDNSVFVCKICGRTFNTKGSCKRHVSHQHVCSTSNHKCPHCDYACKFRFNLATHIKRVHPEKITLIHHKDNNICTQYARDGN